MGLVMMGENSRLLGALRWGVVAGPRSLALSDVVLGAPRNDAVELHDHGDALLLRIWAFSPS